MTHHDLMRAIKEVHRVPVPSLTGYVHLQKGRLPRVEHRRHESLILVKHRGSPLPHAPIAPFAPAARATCCGSATKTRISTERRTPGQTHGMGCQLRKPTFAPPS
jgi:hypothetical protein